MRLVGFKRTENLKLFLSSAQVINNDNFFFRVNGHITISLHGHTSEPFMLGYVLLG
jgi:hypothetical protein